MTVSLPNHTLISDREVLMLRQLVEAATLTLMNHEPDVAIQNLSALERQLSRLASSEPLTTETLRYGTVSLRNVTRL